VSGKRKQTARAERAVTVGKGIIRLKEPNYFIYPNDPPHYNTASIANAKGIASIPRRISPLNWTS